VQHRHRRLRQPHPVHREQLPRLGQAEPQVGRPELDQPAVQPQPVQAQPHVVASGQHAPQLPRRPQHQQLQLPQHIWVELVEVVDDQAERNPQW